MEFLVEIEVTLPQQIAAQERSQLVEAEARRGRELQEAGTIVRIWRIPGRTANVGIWEAPDPTALHAAIASLPMFPYLKADVTPLAAHPLEA
ncbi:MAG: muconolactone Delta-isomerase family protein [Conexibacter sp.]